MLLTCIWFICEHAGLQRGTHSPIRWQNAERNITIHPKLYNPHKSFSFHNSLTIGIHYTECSDRTAFSLAFRAKIPKSETTRTKGRKCKSKIK